MKFFLAVGGLLLVSAVPARAQLGVGVGGSISRVSFPTMLSYPATQFDSTVVSGSKQDFVPTTYVPFDRGLELGRASLAATSKSLAEVAAENSRAVRPKAKVAFVQNSDGDAIITRR
jgi:hypothetical protein